MTPSSNLSIFTYLNMISLRDALKLANSVLQTTSLHDAVNTFRSVRFPVRRRAAAYSRSSAKCATAELDDIARFAEETNVEICTYFFDRRGELTALSLIAERRSEFDVLLVDAIERRALEDNEAFMRAVAGLTVIWVAEGRPGGATDNV